MTHALQPTHDDTDTAGSDGRAGQDVLAQLAALAVEEPPEWQQRALCAQTDPEAFFPEKGGSTREAKQICQGCEVRAECLEAALCDDERFGIWGGLSERERRRLKRSAPDATRAAPAQPAGLEAAPPSAPREQTRRESAPAPGGGRHAGGTRLATSLPTEPRHPRGRPVQPRPSTFPDRARATQQPSAEHAPAVASPSATRSSTIRGQRSHPGTPTRKAALTTTTAAEVAAGIEQPGAASGVVGGAAAVTALRQGGLDPQASGEGAEDQPALVPEVSARPPDPAFVAPPGVNDVLERVLAAHAAELGADTVRVPVVAALAAGEPVDAASLWEIALAAVIAVESGSTRGTAARLLGEDTRDVAHWVRRHWEGMPMVDPRRDGTPEGTTPEPRQPLGGAR